MEEFKDITLDDLKQRMRIYDTQLENLRGEEKIVLENLETKQSDQEYKQAGKKFDQLSENIAEKEAYKEALQFLIDNYDALVLKYETFPLDIEDVEEFKHWVEFFEQYYSDAVDVDNFFFWWRQWLSYKDSDCEHVMIEEGTKQLENKLKHFLELQKHEPGNSGFPGKTDSDTDSETDSDADSETYSDTERPNKRPRRKLRHQLLQKPLVRF